MSPDVLTSTANPLVKEVAALRRKKVRDDKRLILVETPHPIEEAVKAGLPLVHGFVLEDQAPPAGMPDFVTVSAPVMKKMAATDSPPPCLAVMERPSNTLEHLPETKNLFLVLLDGLQDPGNVGAIIRSALAFGADGVLLTPGCADPYGPKVIRASAGLVFRLPVVEGVGAEALAALADYRFYLAESGTGKPLNYREADWTGPVVLVLGSEGRGVSEIWRQADNAASIRIPMRSGVDSLNVAASAAVILSEAARRRGLG